MLAGSRITFYVPCYNEVVYYYLYLYFTLLFSLLQFEAIHQYINNGGSVLFMLTEGGEARLNTNVNFFLEEYGVMVNPGE